MKKVLYLGMVVFILVILASCIPDDTLPPTTPNAPTNLEAEVISSSEIKLTWNDNSDNEVGFKIERKTDSTDWDEIKTVEANTITYTDTELTSNTRYYYRVKAYNQSGESAYSNTVETVTNPLAPAAPTNLEAEVISSSEIKLTWNDNSDNEVGFKIERKTDSTDWDEIKTVEANTITYTDTELTSNTRYYYRVKAYNQSGESAYSNTVETVTNPLAPAAPTNLEAEVISSSEIKLTWNDNSDNEVGFKIERKTDSTDWDEIKTVEANTITYTDTELTSNTRYYYRVKAYNQSGESDYSNMISITTLSCEAIKWKFKTAEDIQSSPAIGSDGTIYVGSGDNYLYAINHDGSEKWKFKTDYSIYSSPAIGDDGTIYVASEDSYLYAINPNGSEKWKFKTASSIHSSPAIGNDGTIYVGSDDNYLYAINPDGSLKWKFKTAEDIQSSPAIGSDGTIYVGSGDNYLYAINHDGSEKWKFKTDYSIYSSPAIGDDGTIYVASEDSYLYAINPNGSEKWKFKTASSIHSSPAIGNDGTIYVGSDDNYLYAINPDGSLKWKFKTDYSIYSSPAIGDDGTIYVASMEDSYLYAINPDGILKWEYKIGGWNNSSPAIGDDGTIYIGTTNGYLYAIQGESEGLADAPWPKFGKNNRNTGNYADAE